MADGRARVAVACALIGRTPGQLVGALSRPSFLSGGPSVCVESRAAGAIAGRGPDTVVPAGHLWTYGAVLILVLLLLLLVVVVLVVVLVVLVVLAVGRLPPLPKVVPTRGPRSH